MQDSLKTIIETVRNYQGLVRKRPIKEIYEKLGMTAQYGNQLPNYGEDTAVIPWREGYLLLAADGMMTQLLVNEPYAAGKASVMVTVNDIYAMGGKPIGMVNVMASGDDEQRAKIVDGIANGCRKLMVPMLGGHVHPDAAVDCPALSVAILGQAENLLRSHLAQSGDELILAVDLSGQAGCHTVLSWDANSGKTAEELLFRLAALPMIANRKLCQAAKDISNAGILGTIAIMLENSAKGGLIDLERIPRPDGLALKDWLLSFQSFGFILSVNPQCTSSVLDVFAEHRVTAAVIGKVVEEPVVRVKNGAESGVLFDFNHEIITGIACPRTD
ncbi:MAG: AIR synthase related protein [Desulfobacterales bacterium]|jgi:selenophosphate synthetase-related protein